MSEFRQPRRKLPIGISDFRMIRMENRYYADKTPLIQEVIDAAAQVLLLPRPRRFGKTLNLSMLRYFFERSERTAARCSTGAPSARARRSSGTRGGTR